MSVRVVDDDGRAKEKFVARPLSRYCSATDTDRRFDRHSQIDTARPPVPSWRYTAAHRHCGGLCAGGDRPTRVFCRLAHRFVCHGSSRSRFLVRSGGRGRLLLGGRIFGRILRAGGNGHRLLPQRFLSAMAPDTNSQPETPTRAYAQRQNNVVALFHWKKNSGSASGSMIFLFA